MDNTTRSERTKAAVIEAALAIIARDGAGRLTLDAIAKESGVSKGGLLHQFPNKRAVLAALLEYQADYYTQFAEAFVAEYGAAYAEPALAAQIAVFREIVKGSNSIAFAILGVASQEPAFMSPVRERDEQTIALIVSQARDPGRSLARLFSARGLALSAMLGTCPLGDVERDRMFEYLLDDRNWPAEPPAPAEADKPRRSRRTTS
ncbi:TetR/AcrR family transcriptional regulator [Xanthobacter aminoxidans]|uniref:TetR/AcrR family transcriptional regulator n=1 Tax=Xanthobacter aminoxidans TaxID=186280 RepID=UPI0037281DD1